MTTQIAMDVDQAVQGRATPREVLKSIVDGINTGNLDAIMTLYEPEAALCTGDADGAQRGRALSSSRRILALCDR
jgi:hypothetical protein